MNFSNVTETAASSSFSEQKSLLAFPVKINKATIYIKFVTRNNEDTFFRNIHE